MDEYSLGFGNPQTGRLAATNPDLSTKDLPSVTYLTSWDSIMMWFKKEYQSPSKLPHFLFASFLVDLHNIPVQLISMS